MERRLLLAMVLLWAAPTLAQEALSGDRYRVRPAVDVPVLLAAAVLWGGPPFIHDELIDPSCPCEEAEVAGVDRWSIGIHSDATDLASDIGLGLAIAGPFAVAALEARGSPGGWERFAEDAVVMGQALVVSGAITQLTKIAVQRPRPHLYPRSEGDSELSQHENYLSFPSGHVASVFAIGLSAAHAYSLHHPEGRHRRTLYAAAIATGSATGALRVLSGRHFATDVLAGAAIGTASGLLVPRLHTRGSRAAVGFSPSGVGVTLRMEVE